MAESNESDGPAQADPKPLSFDEGSQAREDTLRRTARSALGSLLVVLITGLTSLGFGYGFATDSFGFAQPAILPIMFVAAAAGGAMRGLIRAALAGVSVGFAGAAGMIMQLCPNEEYWGVISCSLGSLTGIACLVAACLTNRALQRMS